MPDDLIYSNGVNGLTGELLLPPLHAADIAALAKGERPAPQQRWLAQASARVATPMFGLPFDVDPANVAQAGWAVVYASDEAAAVKRALEPLVEHRRARIGQKKVKVLDLRPEESWQDWLARHDVGPGSMDPARIPYYVLLVGAPSRVPFGLQYLLDVEYAVGRLHFDDAADYARYAQAVVDYETSGLAPRDRSAAFFATRHPFERATQLSADLLMKPLAAAFSPGGKFAASIPDRDIHASIGEGSTKAALLDILAGKGPAGRPGLLLSATHGLGGWPAGHPEQLGKQGALLCQDWSGIGAVEAGQYVAASDLPADAHLHGLVAFFFACYGAGTPQSDPYIHQPGQPPPVVAPAPFVAALPKAMLSHPNGGALAVIGHIERAWGYSFLSDPEHPLIAPFENAVGRILTGQPVGYAVKDFNERYAMISALLSGLLEKVGFKLDVPDEALARAWVERNDAQNYIVLGDPAVALKVA